MQAKADGRAAKNAAQLQNGCIVLSLLYNHCKKHFLGRPRFTIEEVWPEESAVLGSSSTAPLTSAQIPSSDPPFGPPAVLESKELAAGETIQDFQKTRLQQTKHSNPQTPTPSSDLPLGPPAAGCPGPGSKTSEARMGPLATLPAHGFKSKELAASRTVSDPPLGSPAAGGPGPGSTTSGARMGMGPLAAPSSRPHFKATLRLRGNIPRTFEGAPAASRKQAEVSAARLAVAAINSAIEVRRQAEGEGRGPEEEVGGPWWDRVSFKKGRMSRKVTPEQKRRIQEGQKRRAKEEEQVRMEIG
eukprot:TRINITY_DN4578_c0_g1_i1.p1 TRINITY_DN4578_c0_g1~~TRINITY_DN4578_c0_g1_i1.p1  ORF type:complete len:301 (-),score=63.29 TRINITY_DN4578_c0_g1_i1:61-963(-)